MLDTKLIMLMTGLLLALGCQCIAWFWQLKHRNADGIDLAWSASISLIVIFYVFAVDSTVFNRMFVLLFPVLWYLRLSVHLWKRIDVKHEDNRYQYLRRHWSDHTQLKFFGFGMFQSLLSFIFALPAYWVLTSEPLTLWPFLLATVFGLFCLIAVTVSDWQLYNFKQKIENKNKVCDQGLWRYSRHPNYFFEWMHWWVYPIVLFPTDYFCWSLVVVFVMLFFILKLTGIPFAEQQALRSRGEAYRAYQKNTSAFVLWRKK